MSYLKNIACPVCGVQSITVQIRVTKGSSGDYDNPPDPDEPEWSIKNDAEFECSCLDSLEQNGEEWMEDWVEKEQEVIAVNEYAPGKFSRTFSRQVLKRDAEGKIVRRPRNLMVEAYYADLDIKAEKAWDNGDYVYDPPEQGEYDG